MRSLFAVSVLALSACIFPLAVVSGPGNLSLQVGHASRDDHSRGVLTSWENRSAFFVEGAYTIRPWAQVASRFTFRSGDFERYMGPVVYFIPEDNPGEYRADPLKAVEIAMGIHLSVGQRLRMRASILPGVLVAAPVSVSRTVTDFLHRHPSYIYTAPGTGQQTVAFILGFGLGLRFDAVGPIAVGIAAESWVSPRHEERDPDLSRHLSWDQVIAYVEVRHP